MDECILCASEKEGNLLLLELRRGAVLKTYKGCNSSGGALCVLGGPRSFQGSGGAGDYIYAAQAKRPAVHVWNWSNGNVQLQCHVQEIMTCMSTHPSGQYVFAGSRSGKLYVWQASSGALVRTVNAHYRGITRCKVSSCGTYVVTSSEDSTVCVWSASDLVGNPFDHAPAIRAFKSFSVHSLPVLDVCVMGSGPAARIATASADRTIKIIQICSGDTLQTLSFPTTITVCGSNQTEDLLLAGGENGTVYMLDMHATAMAASMAHTRVHGKSEDFANNASQPTMHTLTGHEGALTSVAVSADNVTAVSGGSDGTVRLWDLETRQCINVVKPHSNAINDIVLVPRPDVLSTAVNKPTLVPIGPLRKYADTAGDLQRHRILLTPVDVDAVPAFENEMEEEPKVPTPGHKRGRDKLNAGDKAADIPPEDEEDGFISLPSADHGPTRTLREALVMPLVDRNSLQNGFEEPPANVGIQELEELRQRIRNLNDENERWRAVAKKLKNDLNTSGRKAASTASATSSAKKARKLEAQTGVEEIVSGDSIANRVRSRRKSLA